jgi:SAM-dependent methyltransferase
MADPGQTKEPAATPAVLPPEAAWYDRHYAVVQPVMPPWYEFMVPDLAERLGPETRLLECGCGQGHVLRHLVAAGRLAERNVYAVDQSLKAVEFLRARLPAANVAVMDLNRIAYPDASFDVVLLMETIEHLEDPRPVLEGIARLLRPGGWLYLSFPNYLHWPWWVVRVLAEKLNRPNWIVLQPIDKIYTVLGIVRRVKAAGLRLHGGIGSLYGPPLLYLWEPKPLTRLLNRLGLYWLSFHPILRFRKE